MDRVGALAFGLVIGWVTYRTLRRSTEQAAISDIASVIAAVGGGAVTALFDDSELFGWYAVGLAAGFFVYLAVGVALEGKESAGRWMLDD
jgi:hypothetical protein